MYGYCLLICRTAPPQPTDVQVRELSLASFKICLAVTIWLKWIQVLIDWRIMDDYHMI